MTPESRTVVRRPSWRDEHLECLCGFANAQGGVLEVGKDNRGEIVGVSDVLWLLEEIPRKTQALLGVVPDVSLKSEFGREYVEVAVQPHANPISYKGEYHHRNGGAKRVLGDAEISGMFLQRHGRTWDDAPWPSVALQDLDPRAIDLFRQRAAGCGRLPPEVLDESAEDLMRRLNLREAPYLKRAAVLLFHPEPHRIFLGTAIKIGYFRGSEILFHDVVEGDLFTQVDETVDLLYTKYNRALFSCADTRRVDRFPVPRQAVREAVVNAVVHADYARPFPIQIRVYDDRIAIWNAAVLDPEWTADQVADKLSSRPRNPKMAYAFFRAGLIEAWGRGVRQMIDSCRDAGNPPPTWRLERDGDGLWVRFPYSAGYQASDRAGREVATPVAATPVITPIAAGNGGEPPEIRQETTGTTRKRRESPEHSQNTARSARTQPETSQKLAERMLAHLRAHPSASRRQLAVSLDVTESRIRYQLDKLKASGLLRRVGPDRGGTWVVAPDSPENRQKTAGNHPDQPETVGLPDRILALLSQNPSASRREVAAALGTTESAIRYRLDKLRAEGRIERVGPDKGGIWKVLDLEQERRP